MLDYVNVVNRDVVVNTVGQNFRVFVVSLLMQFACTWSENDRLCMCVCDNGSRVDHNNGRTDNKSDGHRSVYHNNADSIRYSAVYHRSSVSQLEAILRRFIGNRLHSTVVPVLRRNEHNCKGEITVFHTHECSENSVARP